MREKTIFLTFVFALLFCLATTIAFPEDFIFVDLKPHANSKIMETSWWTGLAGNTDFEEALEIAEDGYDFELPAGNTVPFKIEDAVLTVFGTNSAGMPISIEGIKIEATAESIYFLHMTAWENVGAPSYKFIMEYDDGKTEELLMESNINSDNWDQVPGAVPAPMADENSAWVWRESAVTVANGGLISTRWDNPEPAKRIMTIDLVSLETAAVPALFALTLGEASTSVEPGEKLPSMWSEIKSE